MYPEELVTRGKQKALYTSKWLYGYVFKQFLLIGLYNTFLWNFFRLEAFASFYGYGPWLNLSMVGELIVFMKFKCMTK